MCAHHSILFSSSDVCVLKEMCVCVLFNLGQSAEAKMEQGK